MKTVQITPRFKVGDLIQYRPLWGLSFKKRPVYRVEEANQDENVYRLVRTGGKKSKRVLPFHLQRRYWVHNLPKDQQPPMWPKPDDQ